MWIAALSIYQLEEITLSETNKFKAPHLILCCIVKETQTLKDTSGKQSYDPTQV